jgi:hypothetical protein
VVSVVVAVLVRVEDVGETGEDVADLGDLVEDGGVSPAVEDVHRVME